MSFREEASVNKVFEERPIRFKGKKFNVEVAIQKSGITNAQQNSLRVAIPPQAVATTYANEALPMSCQMPTVQKQQLVAEQPHYLQYHPFYAPYNTGQNFNYIGQNFITNNANTTNYTKYDPFMVGISYDHYSYTNCVYYSH